MITSYVSTYGRDTFNGVWSLILHDCTQILAQPFFRTGHGPPLSHHSPSTGPWRPCKQSIGSVAIIKHTVK